MYICMYIVDTERLAELRFYVYRSSNNSELDGRINSKCYCIVSPQVIGCDFLISATGVCSCNDFLNSAEPTCKHTWEFLH